MNSAVSHKQEQILRNHETLSINIVIVILSSIWSCWQKPSTHIDEIRKLTIGGNESLVLSWAKKIPERIPDSASEFQWTSLAAGQRLKNLNFRCVRAEAMLKRKIKNKRQDPKHLQEVSADENGRLVRALSKLAIIVGFWDPQKAIPHQVLEIIQSRSPILADLSSWLNGKQIN